MTETGARIRWTDNGMGGFEGHVGTSKRHTFELWQAPAAAGFPTGDWVVTSELPLPDASNPGYTYAFSGKDPEELKAQAERRLGGFTASLGAVFPGGHPDGNTIAAYCATDTDDDRHLLQYAVRLPDGTTTAYGDQSWVKAGLGARDHDGASTVVRDIWVSYGPWRTHETNTAGRG